MTKHYEEQELAAFVNGILGSFVRTENLPDPMSRPGAVQPESGE